MHALAWQVGGMLLAVALAGLAGPELIVAAVAGEDYRRSSVATDEVGVGTSGPLVHLLVYERRISTANHDILAQRLAADGAPQGSPIVIAGTTSNELAPSVARCNYQDRFVVVWQRGEDVLARTVDGATGTLGAVLVVAGTTAREIRPDVGGEDRWHSLTTSVLCVYENATSNRIVGARLDVLADGSLSLLGTTTIRQGLSPTTVSHPRISRSGGSSGRHLAVWQLNWTNPSVQSDLNGAVLASDLTVLASGVIANDQNQDEDLPAVDGDGTNWVVAWQQDAVDLVADPDVAARAMTWDAVAGALVAASPVRIVDATPGEDEEEPAVGVVGRTALVAFQQRVAPAGDRAVFVQSLDLFGCTPCEGRVALPAHAGDDESVTIARLHPQYPGTSSSAEPALLVWTVRDPLNGAGAIHAQRWTSADGNVATVGIPCGQGGTAEASCAVVGNADFALRLRGARAGAASALVVSLRRVELQCGSCVLVADPFAALSVAVLVADAMGNATLPVAIPADPQLQSIWFYAQWLVSAFGAQPLCPALGSFVSAGIAVRVQ